MDMRSEGLDSQELSPSERYETQAAQEDLCWRAMRAGAVDHLDPCHPEDWEACIKDQTLYLGCYDDDAYGIYFGVPHAWYEHDRDDTSTDNGCDALYDMGWDDFSWDGEYFLPSTGAQDSATDLNDRIKSALADTPWVCKPRSKKRREQDQHPRYMRRDRSPRSKLRREVDKAANQMLMRQDRHDTAQRLSAMPLEAMDGHTIRTQRRVPASWDVGPR